MEANRDAKPTFKAFLSHRYKSPAENQRFFDLLSAYGNLSFEVDVGVKATNVTRLERLVRDADAFVGIYPYPSEDDERPDAAKALEASRYFRLELDLALRARRPTMLFVDAKYGTAITAPQTVRVFQYERREIFAATSDRRDKQLARLIGDFCDDVDAAMRLKGGQEPPDPNLVGIMLPAAGASAYTKEQVEKMEECLAQKSLRAVHLDCGGRIDGALLRELERLDWAVVDIGAESCACGIPSFLHGYYLPQMRLVHTEGNQSVSPLEKTLLSGFDVGYPKDIIHWSDDDDLQSEFLQRLTTLYQPRKSITTSEEAAAYFSGAAKRKEAVFLSYSGDDRDVVAGLANALRRRFQDVFDYRDQGESIMPGRRWLDEIFDKLSSSAIGIPVLSERYLSSGNCSHEARNMMALADEGKLKLIPVKLKEGPLDLPNWIKDLQYLRAWEYTAEQLVDKIISCYDEPA